MKKFTVLALFLASSIQAAPLNFQGQLNNLSSYDLSELEIWGTTWCSRYHSFNGREHYMGGCGRNENQGKILSDGSVEIDYVLPDEGAKRYPGYRYKFHHSIYVQSPSGKKAFIELDQLKDNQLYFIDIRSHEIELKVTGVEDINRWFEDVTPDGRLDYELSIRKQNSEKKVFFAEAKLTGDSKIQIEGYPVLLSAPLNGPHEIVQTVKSIYDSGMHPDRPRAVIKQSVVVQEYGPDFIHKHIPVFEMNPQDMNTDPSGKWIVSTTIMHDLGKHVGMAVDGGQMDLELECKNHVLTGHGVYVQESGYKKRSEDPNDRHPITVEGTCSPGRGEFSHSIVLKEYLGEKRIEKTLSFFITGVYGQHMRFAIYVPESDEPVGKGWAHRLTPNKSGQKH